MKSVLWPILDMRISQTQPLNDYISRLSELQNVRNWNRGMDKINFQHLCFVHFTTFGRNLSKKCGSRYRSGKKCYTVESRFLEPPGETKIGSRNREFEKSKVASNVV